MKSVEESVVMALDGGSNPAIFPYLSYILQDLWEMGADPETVIQVIGRHFPNPHEVNMLDLGCGKGAVSIQVAHRFRCRCHGIDAVSAFIQEADSKAAAYGVEDLCRFQVGDIREMLDQLPVYEVILQGAIGPVLGNYENTLIRLEPHMKEEGLIIIDDAYIEGDSDFRHPLILPFPELERQVNAAGFRIEENLVLKGEAVEEAEVHLFEPLKIRCLELAERYPEKKSLFLDYIKNQEYEGKVNARHAVCTTLVLKK